MISSVISVRSWLWRQRALVVGLLLTGSGAALAVFAARGDSDFGWFGYAPLGDSVFTTDGVFVLRRLTVIGFVLLAVGLMWVAGIVGYRLALRRGEQRVRSSA